MPQYKEKKDKNNLTVSNTDNSVKIKVDCQYGTIAFVSFNGEDEIKTVECGKEEVIGKANKLKGKSVKFSCTSSNPDDGQIKIIHTIYETGGNKLIYTFPDDYTGTPDFHEDDKEPFYKFYCNFI
ncbi:hypothetical protein ACFLSE_05775 [Bacteroidota bacterium]